VIQITLAHWLHADSGVTGYLGTNPMRLYPFGETPDAVTLAYATWQTVTGAPENNLSEPPPVDHVAIQFDVWTKTAQETWALYQAMREVLEGHGHETFFGNERRSPDVRGYGMTFTFEFWLDR
jgi:hypothetical protein